MGLSKKMQSYPVSDIFNPNRHLPHPPTSERCSDFQKSSVIVDHPLLNSNRKLIPKKLLEIEKEVVCCDVGEKTGKMSNDERPSRRKCCRKQDSLLLAFSSRVRPFYLTPLVKGRRQNTLALLHISCFIFFI